jgi:phosphatidylserine/phosphatidylglycerophosphate/cardiolipin synthase-like enzyme
MHHKFFIFDGLNVWTGATNITRNGIYNNNNNAILIQSLELAANYQAEFDEMFSDGAFGRGDDTRQTPNRFITVGNTLIETYFAPEDGRDIEARLVELVNSAQRSVRVMAFSFTLNSVGDAMLNRMNQGVLVEGVFETTGSTRGQMPKLFCAGANVVQDGNPSIMHHKVFIIDEQIVVMGSFNFSSSARDTNSENLLAIHNPNIAALYLAEFQRVLSEGRVPDRSAMRCAA